MENLKNPTPVVGEVDYTIQWINLSPVDSTVHFVSTDLQDSNLSVGLHYLPFIQLGPEGNGIG